MGQGTNKIANSLLDIQPTAVLEFYRIYPDTLNKPNLFIPVHGGSIFGANVSWQNVEYIPVPIEGEGFEINGNGQLARPKLRIANKDFLITNLLQNNFDFKNAKIVRKRTFLKYLDDSNFDGGNPFGTPDYTAEISNETYLIGQKTAENKVYVEFELTSPLDLENFEVTHRQILAKYCYWQYRGHGCNFVGGPVEKENGYNFTDITGALVIPKAPLNGLFVDVTNIWSATKGYLKGDICYLENSKIYINKNPNDANSYTGPLRNWYVSVADSNLNNNPETNPTYWQKDGCSKKISSCKKRFNTAVNVPYYTNVTTETTNFIGLSGIANSTTPFSTTAATSGSLKLNQDLYTKFLNFRTNFTASTWIKRDSTRACSNGSTILSIGPSCPIALTVIKDATNYAYQINFIATDIYPGSAGITSAQVLINSYNALYINKADVINGTQSFAGNALDLVSIQCQRNLSSPHNYLRYSNTFNSTNSSNYWVNNNCTVVDNTTATTNPYGITGNTSQITSLAGTIDCLGVSGNANLIANLNTDLGISAPSSYTDYNQIVTFSIWVKQPTANAARYFYIRFEDWYKRNGKRHNQFIVFDLQAKTFTNYASDIQKATDYTINNNYGNYYMPFATLYDAGNGWLRLSVTMLNETYNVRAFTNINFGPLPGTLSPSFIKYYDANTADEVLRATYTSGLSVYVYGALLEGGRASNNEYQITSGKAYFHPDFNFWGNDIVNVNINGVNKFSWQSQNKNQLITQSATEFSIGSLTSSANQFTINADIGTSAIWGRFVADQEFVSLYKTTSVPPTYQNDFTAYPIRYYECTGGSLSQITGNKLMAWWDMTGNANIITDLHTGSNNLKVYGTNANKSLSYAKAAYVLTNNFITNTSLPFGGFPGTDGFNYGR